MAKVALAAAAFVVLSALRCSEHVDSSIVRDPSPLVTTPGAPAAERAPDPPAEATGWTRLASEDGVACREKLAASGARFRVMPDRIEPDERGCGMPHGVVVQRGPLGIVYTPPLVVDCSMALELPEIERTIQEQSREHLGTTIRKITTFGTFSCRNVRGGWREHLSEHAFGNAIDFGAFLPEHGKTIVVARDYRPAEEPSTAAALFLRGLFEGLRSCAGLTYVIGPPTRADHHDHIHVDRAQPWWRLWPIAQPG